MSAPRADYRHPQLLRSLSSILKWWLLGIVAAFGFALAGQLLAPPTHLEWEADWSPFPARYRSPLVERYVEGDYPTDRRIADRAWSIHSRLNGTSFATEKTGIFGNPPDDEACFTSQTAGWPLRCAWGWHYDNAPVAWTSRSPPPLLPFSTSFGWLGPSCVGPGGRCVVVAPIVVPLLIDGLVFAPGLALAWAAARRLRARFRIVRALCPRCAYDLRATPPGQPCPECGAPQARTQSS